MAETVTYWKQADDKFFVRAYCEPNRHGNPRYRVRYRERGSAPVTESVASEQEAVKNAKIIWMGYLGGEFAADVPDDPTRFADLIENFTKRDGLSPASVRSYRQALGVFAAHVGDRPIGTIGKGTVEQWLASLTCKPVSKATYLRSLSALYKWAVERRLVKADPTAGVRVAQARAGTTLRPWLQATDWPAYLAACGETHRLRSEFVLHTGLRLSELVAVRWEQIIGPKGKQVLSMPAGKSVRARAIPLDDRALAVLDRCKAKWGNSGPVFGKDEVSKNNLRRDTVRACQRAKVPQVDFHGLRRSAGAWWLECGMSLLTVSRLLGHAEVGTTAKHYVGLSDALLMAEVGKANEAIRAAAG